MNKILWISLLESIKGISIGLAAGFVIVMILSEEYTIKQFTIGILILIFLSTGTIYHANLKLYKNRKEIEDIKKHL